MAEITEALDVKRRGRRRLIGAVALALILIVALPMIFDSQPKRAGETGAEISLTIPPKDGLALLPAPAATKTEVPDYATKPVLPANPQTAALAMPEPKVAMPSPEPDVPVMPPVEAAHNKALPSKVNDKSALEAAPAVPKNEGFAVQFGAFSDTSKVALIKARAAKANISVYSEEIKTAAGTLIRIRAGPFKTREQADKVLRHARDAKIDDGKVVPLP